MRKFSPSVVRNFVFGVEDSLVSTVGLLSGVAAAGSARETIILTGVILIFVEAFSMAVGSFLSENSAAEYATQKDLPLLSSFGGGVVMFFSYFVSGFIPLSPYIFLSNGRAMVVSIALSLFSLFLLGFGSGKISNIKASRSALQMFFIGGFAVIIGVAVGVLLKSF